jgi:amidase
MSGWEARAAVRRDALSKRIPPARQVAFPPAHELACVQDHPHISSLLTTHELEVTTAPTPEILRQLQRGTWTAEATVAAYCKRAALAQQALNYATDIFFDEAINTAREYDEYFRSNRGKVKGPLHGLPISIKDPFDVAGHFTTSGLVSRIDSITGRRTRSVNSGICWGHSIYQDEYFASLPSGGVNKQHLWHDIEPMESVSKRRRQLRWRGCSRRF